MQYSCFKLKSLVLVSAVQEMLSDIKIKNFWNTGWFRWAPHLKYLSKYLFRAYTIAPFTLKLSDLRNPAWSTTKQLSFRGIFTISLFPKHVSNTIFRKIDDAPYSLTWQGDIFANVVFILKDEERPTTPPSPLVTNYLTIIWIIWNASITQHKQFKYAEGLT